MARTRPAGRRPVRSGDRGATARGVSSAGPRSPLGRGLAPSPAPSRRQRTRVMLAAAALLAALLAVIDTVPYVRDILRGTTRPQRATWLIWSVLGVAAFAAQAASGPNWSLVMIGSEACVMVLIFVLAIPHGEGGLRPIDLTMLCLAGLGLVGWAIVDEPVVATMFVVVADAIGLGLMVPKTVRDPQSETLSTFVLASVS